MNEEELNERIIELESELMHLKSENEHLAKRLAFLDDTLEKYTKYDNCIVLKDCMLLYNK